MWAASSNQPFTTLSGLCPDWAEWDPNQPVQNAREAMQQADDWLGVPQVRSMTVTKCYFSVCFSWSTCTMCRVDLIGYDNKKTVCRLSKCFHAVYIKFSDTFEMQTCLNTCAYTRKAVVSWKSTALYFIWKLVFFQHNHAGGCHEILMIPVPF